MVLSTYMDVKELDYIERTDDGCVYVGEPFGSYSDPIEWDRLKNIVQLTDWTVDGKSTAPDYDVFMEVCEKISEEYGLTLTVRLSTYRDGNKEATLQDLNIEEDIDVREEYAELRQYLVDKFGHNRPFYRIDLSGNIKKTGS